jgi:hypothetical protein
MVGLALVYELNNGKEKVSEVIVMPPVDIMYHT